MCVSGREGCVWRVCVWGGRGDTYQSSLRWQNFSVFVCLSNNRSTTSGFCLQRKRGREGRGGREGRRGGREGRGGEGGREGREGREGRGGREGREGREGGEGGREGRGE